MVDINSSYTGPSYRPDFGIDVEKEIERKFAPNKAASNPTQTQSTVEAEATPEEINALLQTLDSAVEMPPANFITALDEIRERASRISNRIDTIVELLDSRNISINITDPEFIRTYTDIFGKDTEEDNLGRVQRYDPFTEDILQDKNGNYTEELTLTTPAVKCIAKMASNQKSEEVAQRVADAMNFNSDSSVKDLGDGLEEEAKAAFPNFGLEFLIALFKIFAKTLIKMVFGKLYCVLKDIVIPPKIRVGKFIAKPIASAGNALLRIIDSIPGDKGFVPRGGRIEDSCDGRLDNPDFITDSLLQDPSSRPRINNAQYGEDNREEDEACHSNPSPQIQAKANDLMKHIIKSEIRDESNTDYTFAGLSIAQRLKNETLSFSNQMDGMRGAIVQGDNKDYTVDKVRANIIAMLSMINETLKAIDITVSGLTNMSFLTPFKRELVCCTVRLLYILIPQALLNKDMIDPDSDKYDPEKYNSRLEKLKRLDDLLKGKENAEISTSTGDFSLEITPEAEFWMSALDSVLSYMLGSCEVNVDIELPLDQDFLMAAIQGALAETLSFALDGTFFHIQEWTNGIKTSSPTLTDVIEACEPFNFLLELVNCELNGLQNKLKDWLAQMWMKSNATMKSYHSTIELIIRSKNLKFFKNLISLIKNLSANLRGFCDLDKIQPEWAREQAISELEEELDVTGGEGGGGAGGSFTSRLDTTLQNAPNVKEADKLDVLTPVYDPKVSFGPDYDDFINTALFQSSADGPLGFSVNTSPIYVDPDTESTTVQEAEDIANDPRISDDVAAQVGRSAAQMSHYIGDPKALERSVQTCDDNFKDVLRSIRGILAEIQNNEFVNTYFK